MRPLHALAGGLVLLSGTSVAALAQAPNPDPLLAAPFAQRTAPPVQPSAGFGGFDLPPPVPGAPTASLTGVDQIAPNGGLVQWNASETTRRTQGGAVESFRFSTGGVTGPAGLWGAEPDAYDLSYRRGWPGALRGQAGAYPIEVTPFAGLGVGTYGGSAEAGAVIRYGPGARDRDLEDKLEDLGFKDGAAFGDRGRWYLFAAASGRAIGLNVLPGEGRAGWSHDTAAVVGDAQVGIGWRRGNMQTSIGYLHRELDPITRYERVPIEDEDDVIAFSFSLKPQR